MKLRNEYILYCYYCSLNIISCNDLKIKVNFINRLILMENYVNNHKDISPKKNKLKVLFTR